MHRVLFPLLGWGYMVTIGAFWSILPLKGPPPDVAMIMVLYAATGAYGPEEVFFVALMGDLLGGMPLGLGTLGKLLVFMLLGRFFFLVRIPFWALFPFAFSLSLLELLIEELLRALSGLGTVGISCCGVKIALMTALFSYGIFALNNAFLERLQGSGYGPQWG